MIGGDVEIGIEKSGHVDRSYLKFLFLARSKQMVTEGNGNQHFATGTDAWHNVTASIKVLTTMPWKKSA